MTGTGLDRSGRDRRTFVIGATAGALVLGTADMASAARVPPKIIDNPFTLGIASGDPLANGVVICTRLAPDPINRGGMPDATYFVGWELAADPAMKEVVRKGTARAQAKHGHSVHVDVRGLRPEREYWYRFRVGTHISPIGRTRTAPRANTRPAALTFGLVSCQRYSSVYYTAYDDLVSTAPDLVVHVGDYIYESPGNGVRSDPLPESVTLDQYRNRYALYKGDASLQAAHEVAPWLFTSDDHEVENNHAGLVPEVGVLPPTPPTSWLAEPPLTRRTGSTCRFGPERLEARISAFTDTSRGDNSPTSLCSTRASSVPISAAKSEPPAIQPPTSQEKCSVDGSSAGSPEEFAVRGPTGRCLRNKSSSQRWT